MPNPTNVPITPPRVPFLDPRTGSIAREWYRFFLSLFQLTSGSSVSLDDLQKSAPFVSIDDLTATINNATENLTLPLNNDNVQELTKQVEGLSQQPNNLASQVVELTKQVESLQLTPPPREFNRSRYGQFYDTTTQTAAVINTPYAITYNTTDTSSGVYLGSPTSRIYVDEPAVYNFQFSIQLDKTSGGTANFWIWARINGTDVPNSASQVRIQGNDAEVFSSVNFFFNLKAGDYVEFMFAVSDISVQLATFPASAFYPAIPSIIVTVTDNIQGVR